MQAITQGRHIRRHLDFDARDGLASERAALDRSRRRDSHCARALRVSGAYIKMRELTVVAHEKRAAVFQSAVDLDDRHARAIRPVRDPVARLQNEAARLVHRRIVPPLLTSSAL
jgi:hypothetical protein